MSIGGSISGISFGGLSSGIDTTSIIQKLVQLEAQPLQNYQARLNDLQTQQGVLAQFKSKLQALNSAALALSSPYAFNPIKATSSDATVATITGSNTATAGIYNLAVSKLAQSQKISTAAQADTSSALNLSGSFVINGQVVRVSATDSLTKIAQNINSANAGVTASLIDGGAGRAYITVSSNQSGVKNKIQIADATGSVLSSLGVLGGAPSPRETITNGVTSFGFSSQTQTLGQLLPNSGITTASFQVNGTNVDVDFSTDTLQTLAQKLTAAGSASSVRTVTDDQGKTTYKLDIVSSIGGDTFTDGQNVLQSLGVLQQAPSSELIQAQDAAYTLDGVALTSTSNTITMAIPGVTLTLLKGNVATPASTTLTLSKDTDSISQQVHAFADAFNNAIDFVNQNSQFDKDTFATGPLFGDSVARQVVGTVSTLLFSNMPGATAPYTNLASIGFGLDEKGMITVDDSKLSTAINASPDSLKSLFQTVGNSSASGLGFIAAGNATKSGTYNVEITSLATAGSYTAGTAQTGSTANTETLTFSGSLFGSSPVSLVIPQNRTQAEIIDQINADARLKDLILASDDGAGHLRLTSKRSGSGGNFTVSSDRTGGDSSGIGDGTDGSKVVGTDLMGTINGEPATGGANNMLTGNAGNANTAGLQIQYTGTATGFVGQITVNKGMSSNITDLMVQFTDPVSGLLTTRDAALTAQENDVNDSIDRLQTRVKELQVELQTKFANMETAIAQIQQQSLQLQNAFKSSSG